MDASLTQLFFYKMVFLAELLVAEAIFARKLRPRRHFLLRAAAALVFCFAFAYWFPLARHTVLYNSVMFFSLFAVSLAALTFCFEENGWNLLFCALMGYTVQHIAFVVNDTAVVLFRLDTLLSRRMKRGEDLSLGRKPLIVLAGVLVAVDIWFNMITVMNPDATRQTALLACTWNVDLLEEIGQAVGREGAVNGMTGWYAPGPQIRYSLAPWEMGCAVGIGITGLLFAAAIVGSVLRARDEKRHPELYS